jgi:hypothetical protein
LIFAREISDSLTSLVKAIDKATVKNSGAKMGSFVVFCNDDDGLKDKLKELAEKEHLKKIVLTLDNPSGPADYEVAKDADVTVVLYYKQKVKVNKAFKKGELTDKAITSILAEIPKILPEKKKDDKKGDD